jgi:hypothetical protein
VRNTAPAATDVAQHANYRPPLGSPWASDDGEHLQ